VLIPARNEEWLSETVADLLKNIRGKTEIIVVHDGEEFPKPLPEDPRITVIRHHVSRGQRASTNDAARVAQGTYLLKADAHTAWDEGFDVKMIQGMKDCGDNTTLVPVMRNLHVFSWKCYACGWKMYQGPTPSVCPDCKRTDQIRKKFVWNPKPRPQSTSYRFDTELHFQYGNYWTKTEEYKEQLKTGYTETMSLQGSAFMLHRDKYWGLNICDEAFGSWGAQGTEVACKTWLSGGRCIVNHNTWYSHLFRTQGGDFSFPYKQDNDQVARARKLSQQLFLDNTWEHQTLPLSWLVDKFAPVPGWHDGTDNGMLEKIRDHGKKMLK
jgi:rubrerythrin